MKAKASMSRTGCCYDNAPMEWFFHSLKDELVHQRSWATREEARRICSAPSRAPTIGSAFTRRSGISRPSKPSGQRANPVSNEAREDQA
jgi:hypothetical protein